MKTKINIKNTLLIFTICILSLFFINISLAANTAKIIVETAKLRQEASADSKILELASIGEEVEIIEKSGEWYKVKYKNITGYLRNDLIDVKEDNLNNETTTTTDTEETNNTVESEEQTNSNDTNTTETNTILNNQENTENTIENNNKQKGTYIVLKQTNLKITPLINSLDIQAVELNEKIEVTEIINKWAYITKSNGMQGWIILENLDQVKTDDNKEPAKEEEQNKTNENLTETQKTENNTETQQNTKMYINTQTVNLREKADKTSTVLKQLEVNSEVTVISKDNGWCYIEVNGKKGYVAESLLSTSKQATSRSTMNERETNKTENKTTTNTDIKNTETQSTTNTTSSKQGNEVVKYAQSLLGCKYVYGGTTTSGFDCSGFTQYIYKHFGVTLNRTAAAQYSNGTTVTNLQSGDLVMFGKSGINHVGIYIGGNTFIHAANPGRGVTTDTLASGYYKVNYVGAKRIF